MSKRARLLCLRAQSVTRAAASSAVCCCSNFEHGGRCDGRPSTGLVSANPDRGGTCPVSRCCGVACGGRLWCGWAVLLEARRATAALAAHSSFRSFSALPPQLFRITAVAVPHYLHTATALLPHCYRTATALLPHCCRTASALLHGTRSVTFFAGYGYVTTQDGTSRSESFGLRRLEVVRSAHSHCSIPSHPCRALG